MKRKHVLVIGVACACVCAVVLIASLSGTREPNYQGKKLSEWGYEYRLACALQGVPQLSADAPAAMAIRAIGTNALPFGLRWLKHRTPNWKQACLRMKCPSPVRTAVWNTLFQKEERAANGFVVFLALGPEARSAIPELVGILTDPTEPKWMGAVRALECVGPDGYAAMGVAADRAPMDRAEMFRRIARNYAASATNVNGAVSVRTGVLN